MNLKVDDSKKEGVLTIGGTLTIQRSTALKEILLKALGQVDCVKIHFDQAIEVDLAFLQLFCAAHKTSLRKNKKLQIEENQIDVLKKAFKDIGFPQFMKCKNSDDSNHCVWSSGGSHE
ncbi:MAG: STAS domain-containing protein [Nitrospirae bacterium]|jgi:anti-anti-sigma regulatory factor|nr:STAS domain-containing protein [Nitrospirota bacterium]